LAGSDFKSLAQSDQAHLLAKGKLVEQMIKNNLQWVHSPIGQYYGLTCHVSTFILE
jgi:hypothetical protein